ncbi:MAG: type 1 glutamine amidotransferase [Deltaproteobacteria bacterium]|nr:type 1 glutamine amidotransferase [Deltaproteobacteria bacterium]
MRVMVLQHHPDEGPGTLGGFLLEHGADLEILPLFRGAAVPGDADGYDLVVAMGGPMNVYEEDAHPWLKPENELLARALTAGQPVVGVCLGAQLMAKALGAAVVDSPVKELGWYTAELTPQGREDPLFQGVGNQLSVFHWHGDMFLVPAGGRLLATGTGCPHQAFRWYNGWALQFHVEVTGPIVAAWCENDAAQRDALLPGFGGTGQEMAQQGRQMFNNLWGILQGSGALAAERPKIG